MLIYLIFRLDEMSDDSDIDLILPSMPREKSYREEFLDKICCVIMWSCVEQHDF